MVRHAWSIYATLAAVDRVSNNVSIFEAIEQLTVPHPPPDADRFVIPHRSTIVTLWTRADIETGVKALGRTRFLAPDGNELGEWRHEIDLTEHLRTRNRGSLNSLIFTTPGVYEWEISYALLDSPEDWKVGGRIPLQVIFEEAEVEEDD